MNRRLIAIESQARIFAFVWMLRDANKATFIDHDQIEWIYKELLCTFHLTDAGMEAARPIFAELKAASEAAAQVRAEAKLQREEARRIRIMARRAALAAQGEVQA